MRYFDFKTRVRPYPVITASLLDTLDGDRRILRNQLSRWNKQGLIVRLKKGLYLLNPGDRAAQPSKFFLANQLVFPSYVSLESALAYYHMIPENVYAVTSVTTGKPGQHRSAEGSFTFRHVKPSLLFGFETRRDERGYEFFLAGPEKALLDFFYLNLSRFAPDDDEVFSESYRLNARDVVRPARLKEMAVRFESAKLERVVNLFLQRHFSVKKRA